MKGIIMAQNKFKKAKGVGMLRKAKDTDSLRKSKGSKVTALDGSYLADISHYKFKADAELEMMARDYYEPE